MGRSQSGSRSENCRQKILEVSVFAGIEGTGKWTSSNNVPSTMSLKIDALVKGEGAVFNKSFKLFELRWNLVNLVKTPTNPGTGQNLARNAAITVTSTYPGYSAARINDGDRNTALGKVIAGPITVIPHFPNMSSLICRHRVQSSELICIPPRDTHLPIMICNTGMAQIG